MKKALRIAAVVVSTSLSLGTGIASASTGSIDLTGPGSRNTVTSRSSVETRTNNNNNVGVTNNNPQTAKSGNASAHYNTTAGDATSGAAKNDGLVRADLSIDNGSSCGCASGLGAGSDNNGSINTTGPNSHNSVEFSSKVKSTVNNNNNVTVTNNNSQSATTGSAKVDGNTTGGSATSGDASNISTTDVTLHIAN